MYINIHLDITKSELAACIHAHEEALAHHIRDCGKTHPLGDGAIGRITASLEALRKMWPTGPSTNSGPGEQPLKP